MNTNKHELLFKEETYKIIGASIEIINILGNGFLEKVYENAIVTELAILSIPYKQQSRFNITYKNKIIGEYIPDLLVFDNIIVEIKAIERITGRERSQVLNYLKVTGLRLGIILNFGNSKLEWERLVL